jgi:hypothetical protein
LKPHIDTITETILAGCNDSSNEVAVAAVKSATVFIGALSDEPEVMAFEPVLAPAMSVMEKCLASGDEDVVAEGLDMFQECVSMDQPLVNNHAQVSAVQCNAKQSIKGVMVMVMVMIISSCVVW